jgi:hypothetical protein
MDRDTFVAMLAGPIYSSVTGLGELKEEERKTMIKAVAKLLYEIADETLLVGKETRNGK